ncbi:MAG: hypothetical protein AB7O59_23910 [Pirellulales bacterium]
MWGSLQSVGRWWFIGAAAALWATSPLAMRALAADAPVKRARPPKFDKSVTDAFFPDARQKLVGSRPDRLPSADPSGAGHAAPKLAPGVTPPGSPGQTSTWQGLISAEVLEDEIKSQHQRLGAAVQNPLKFKGGEYQQARDHLSALAALFAIDADYGADVRWRSNAAAMRDVLARAGFNCKVGTDASYEDAKARYDELTTLVRGGAVELPAAQADATWDRIADRAPLMKLVEQLHERGLVPWTGSAGEFAAHVDDVSHAAQLIAAVATVIQSSGYEFADDESYRELAQKMGSQALVAREAATNKNWEQARQATGEISKACSNCHEGYRN